LLKNEVIGLYAAFGLLGDLAGDLGFALVDWGFGEDARRV
jgi:hypothetical protein